MNQTPLGLSKKYVCEIVQKAKSLDISEKEAKIVNKYAAIDTIVFTAFDKNFTKSYKSRLEQVRQANVRNYKLFVAIYKDHNNSFPPHIDKFLRDSLCGRAKIAALEYRLANSKEL
jgi:hypothetical protein